MYWPNGSIWTSYWWIALLAQCWQIWLSLPKLGINLANRRINWIFWICIGYAYQETEFYRVGAIMVSQLRLLRYEFGIGKPYNLIRLVPMLLTVCNRALCRVILVTNRFGNGNLNQSNTIYLLPNRYKKNPISIGKQINCIGMVKISNTKTVGYRNGPA